MKKLVMWLLGYRTCYLCGKMKRDVKPLCDRIYDERKQIGWLCFDCYISSEDRILYYGK